MTLQRRHIVYLNTSSVLTGVDMTNTKSERPSQKPIDITQAVLVPRPNALMPTFFSIANSTTTTAALLVNTQLKTSTDSILNIAHTVQYRDP